MFGDVVMLSLDLGEYTFSLISRTVEVEKQCVLLLEFTRNFKTPARYSIDFEFTGVLRHGSFNKLPIGLKARIGHWRNAKMVGGTFVAVRFPRLGVEPFVGCLPTWTVPSGVMKTASSSDGGCAGPRVCWSSTVWRS